MCRRCVPPHPILRPIPSPFTPIPSVCPYCHRKDFSFVPASLPPKLCRRCTKPHHLPPSSTAPPSYCRFCHRQGHVIFPDYESLGFCRPCETPIEPPLPPLSTFMACRYCKRSGHTIKDCPTRPPKPRDQPGNLTRRTSSSPTPASCPTVDPSDFPVLVHGFNAFCSVVDDASPP